MQDSKAVLPLGTLTVEETKAPNGYLLEGAYMQAGAKPRILATKVAAINPTAAFATLDMISLSYTLLTLIYLIILYFNIMYNSL